ncbi:YdcF family protein [Aeromicrobium duanguangcaii]|uniref:YdcF family protein n=1 Tax=Aeromicrobium duanguangcaii TaxID=2968086 RepID=A0ABY5KFY2_9ACTN|nr:YdcF family protein [Aeromicrobium duanguangcaii]MCD9154259.1 YdcF family protein [Aeromicrobium duanguangcaii]UUI68673.1 YdcF family protein [Aeromicrobium duanguangcaii]
MIWTLVALLVVATAVAAWREPRSLSVGVLALLAGGVAVVALAGLDGLIVVLVLALLALAMFAILGGLTMRRQPGRSRVGGVAVALGAVALGYCAALEWVRAEQAEDLAGWLLVLGTPAFYVASLFVAFVGYGAVYGRVVRRWVPPVDVVIVLGAGLHGDRVSQVLASRLDRALVALGRSRSRGRDTHVICSGGQGPDETVPEAVAMARYLLGRGVDDSLVWREDRSTSTDENLRFSAEIAAEHGIEHGRFAVVTNDFHAFRAAMLMRDVGLAGYGLGASTRPRLWAAAVLREFTAVLWEQRLLHALVAVVLTGAAVVTAAAP